MGRGAAVDPIDIRQISEAELEAAADASYRAFGAVAGEEDRRYFRSGFELARSLCAFEGERLVGTSSAASLEVTLPGGAVCAAGGPA